MTADANTDEPVLRLRRRKLRFLDPVKAAQAVVRFDRQNRDVYHRLLTFRWSSFAAVVLSTWFLFNVVFALLYLGVGGVVHLRPWHFVDAFFFSAATMVTLNFGTMYPITVASNALVAVEALGGFLSFTFLTGLMFARFSRPTARVLFSEVAVVTAYDGVPTLMFRAANQRGNQILQAEASVMLVRTEISREGIEMRRIYDLDLIRDHHPVFSLSWTLMHPITESSPLWGYTPERLEREDVFMVVVLGGVDDTFNQTIHARYLYRPNCIRWNHRFAEILVLNPEGGAATDFERFHETFPAPEDASPPIAFNQAS